MTYEGLPRFELVLGEPGYPVQLADAPHPPPVLFGVGDQGSLVPGFAVIGARRATPYGLAGAATFAGWAAAAGYVVVSGGAIGCDQAAHRAALDACGRTVAVMAGGADVVYPRGAGALLERVARSGAVVSEHPWGAEPRKWTFRTRNRIIAGLSQALLVLEAALPSGTFTTADYMLDAGRDVYAVPGSILAPECAGANRLLCQGARPITDPSELALALESALGPPPRRMEAHGILGASDHSDRLLSALRTDPMRPDDAARALGLDIVTVARLIGGLETAGRIARYPDGRYGPCLRAGERRERATMRELPPDE